MAIKPPNYQKDAIPTNRGWVHPRTGELLVSTKISQGDIDVYLGKTVEPEPEAVVIDMTAEVNTMIEDLDKPGALMDAQRADLESLTKVQLEELGREHGIELDRRLTKSKLIEQLLEHLS